MTSIPQRICTYAPEREVGELTFSDIQGPQLATDRVQNKKVEEDEIAQMRLTVKFC